MGTDCKSAAFSFGGSNPPAPTKKTSVENTLVFCFIRHLKFHSQGWIRTAAATSLKTAQKQPSATATSAASGRNREELLGQRPAGCECRPRHEADAGSRNPCSFLAARLANPQLSHNCLSQWGDDRVELFVLCLSLIGHAGVRTAPYTSLTTAPISLRMHSARGAISGGSWAGPGLMQT